MSRRNRKRWPVWLVFIASAALVALPLPDALTPLRPPWATLALIYWIMMWPRLFGIGRLPGDHRCVGFVLTELLVVSFVDFLAVFLAEQFLRCRRDLLMLLPGCLGEITQHLGMAKVIYAFACGLPGYRRNRAIR